MGKPDYEGVIKQQTDHAGALADPKSAAKAQGRYDLANGRLGGQQSNPELSNLAQQISKNPQKQHFILKANGHTPESFTNAIKSNLGAGGGH